MSLRLKPLFLLLLILSISLLTYLRTPQAKEKSRFLYSGDGQLTLNGQKIRFRSDEGYYNEAGLKKIHEIFKGNWQEERERLSLRFLELLDYLQDELKGQSYLLKSGYRSPVFNQSLRDQGKLAAQSSMHTEGAAADLILKGVPSSRVFEFVKSLNCCGIGWYHSQHFHLDSGPARYWDEKTSGTEDKTPQQNEKIILQSDEDFYQSGEIINAKLMRVTQYPIGVSLKWELISLKDEKAKSVELQAEILGEKTESGSCQIIQTRKQARALRVKIADKTPPGSYAFKIKFCNRYDYAKMPQEILSRGFEVLP